MKAFGEIIRELRVENGLLIREVAASLQIDSSLLSRIERGDKRVTRVQVIELARILKTDEDALLVHYLSDRVVYELKDEKLALKAVAIAERKINYLIKGKKKAK